LQNWLNRMAEPLYGRQTPDGYGLAEAAWTSPGQMATRFEIARVIGSGAAPLFRAPGVTGSAEPVPVKLAGNPPLDGTPLPVGEQTREALNAATTAQDRNTLFLASPEFMRR
jgi:hypothetical protein